MVFHIHLKWAWPPCVEVTLTGLECCLLCGWAFISSLIHRPEHVSPLKESRGIDLYTCWLWPTCHSCGVAWQSLAHSCDVLAHASRCALARRKPRSFRLHFMELQRFRAQIFCLVGNFICCTLVNPVMCLARGINCSGSECWLSQARFHTYPLNTCLGKCAHISQGRCWECCPCGSCTDLLLSWPSLF